MELLMMEIEIPLWFCVSMFMVSSFFGFLASTFSMWGWLRSRRTNEDKL